MLSDNENYLVKVSILFFYAGLFFSTLGYIIPSTEYKLLYTVILLILSYCLIWYGKEKVFGTVVTKMIPSTNPKRSITDGSWHIKISFNDDSKSQKEIVRTGTLNFSNSLIGVKVKGGKLLDAETNTLTLGGWLSDNAEILTYDNHEVLYYLYKIPHDNGKGTFEKIGFVCAVKEKGKEVFIGDFQDIKIGSATNLKVTLNKT